MTVCDGTNAASLAVNEAPERFRPHRLWTPEEQLSLDTSRRIRTTNVSASFWATKTHDVMGLSDKRCEAVDARANHWAGQSCRSSARPVRLPPVIINVWGRATE